MSTPDDFACCATGWARVAVQAGGGEAYVSEVLEYGASSEIGVVSSWAVSACGARTLRSWLETERFETAICGEPGATTYVGLNKNTGDGIELPVCATDDYLWVATNNGYRYEVDMWVDGTPSLSVFDPGGERIAFEEALTVYGVQRYSYGFGPDGVYCGG